MPGRMVTSRGVWAKLVPGFELALTPQSEGRRASPG